MIAFDFVNDVLGLEERTAFQVSEAMISRIMQATVHLLERRKTLLTLLGSFWCVELGVEGHQLQQMPKRWP